MPLVLAVDLGRTGCRAALYRGDEAIPLAAASGEGSVGLTAADGPEVAKCAILAVATPLLTRIGHASQGIRVGAAAAGALTAPDAARELAQLLYTSIDADAVAVTSDAITSHAGALAGAPGVVLAAGTGSVTIAIGTTGQFRRVDGWGPWLGDAGSGAWLGRRGLRAAARACDGRGPATRLSSAAREQFGSLSELAARLGADPNPARSVAAFAPAVATAAEQGDGVARQLLDDAAATLADSIVAGAAVLPETDAIAVAIIGGMTKIGEPLMQPLRRALSHRNTRLHLCPARGTSTDGARRLATHRDGIHEPWIARVADTPPLPDAITTPNNEGHT